MWIRKNYIQLSCVLLGGRLYKEQREGWIEQIKDISKELKEEIENRLNKRNF